MPALHDFSAHRHPALQRLNDPLVQVWVLSGAAVILGIIGQVGAWVPDSEGKNGAGSSPSRLLLAGAQLDWKDNFGPSIRHPHRPQLLLPVPATSPRSSSHPAAFPHKMLQVDFAPAMHAASSQPWHYVTAGLRAGIRESLPSACTLQILPAWSGDRRGNAASLAAASASLSPSRACFVIGNGSRSGDGEIEFTAPEGSWIHQPVEVILIGEGPSPTPAQIASAGELLLALEALSGRAIQTADPDQTPASDLRDGS